jgi:hypothetical protein
MASRLAPCPSCSRHVKVGPPSCPFCGGDVPTEVAPRVSKLAPGAPLTRAALMFAGAAAVGACSSSSTGNPLPAYGVFIPDASISDAPVDTGEPSAHYGVFSDARVFDDVGQGGALYGVFTDAQAVEPDAGEDSGQDSGQGAAAYGGFVSPDGSTP